MKAQVMGIPWGLKTTKDMKFGDVAIIRNDGSDDAKLILRTFSNYVNLNNPRETWGHAEFKVDILPPGTRIELVTE